MEFSYYCKRLSERVGINTQSDLAKALGMNNRGTVSNWWNGNTFPNADYIYLLSNIWRVKVEDLFKAKQGNLSALDKYLNLDLDQSATDINTGTAAEVINENSRHYESLSHRLVTLPLLSSDQASDPAKSIADGDIIKKYQVTVAMDEISFGDSAFLYQCSDSALKSNDDRHIDCGEKSLVDPDRAPRPGNIVLVVDPETDVTTLRIYRSHGGGEIEAYPLNDDYPILKNPRIIGVVVFTDRKTYHV